MANRGMWGAQMDTRAFYRNMHANMAQMRREADAENAKAAAKFEKHVRRNVPRDQGDLAGTIKLTRVQNGYEVSIGDAAHPYATALEFGHTLNGNHIPGQRFWTPLKKIYNKRWRAGIRRAMKRVFKNFT